jgi:hypothetical protein
MVPVDSDRIPRVPPYLGFLLFTVSLRVRDFHALRSGFPTRFHFLHNVRPEVLQPRQCRNIHGLGYSPFDRHYSENRFFFLFLQVLRCFSSLRLPHLAMVPGLQPGGLSHSDTAGSTLVCKSPALFAAYHVLLRS